MRHAFLLLAITVFMASACGAPPDRGSPPAVAPTLRATSASATTTPTASPAALPTVPDRTRRWRNAIAAVLPGLERLHPDPFHGTSRAVIADALEKLDAAAPDLDDDEVLVGLMRVFALVSAGGRDAHTGLYAWGYGTYPLHALPIQAWLFDDGPHVVAALPPHQDLVGQRIVAVAGVPVKDVLARLEPLAPRDNAMTVRLLLPRFLVLAEALHGVGITADAETPVDLTLASADGSEHVDAVEQVPMADYNAWAGPYGLFLPPDPAVLARSKPDPALWTATPAPGVAYVGYQSLDGVEPAAVETLRQLLAADATKAVIVDVRRNTGGEERAIATLLEPLLEATDPARARPPSLWILTGRNTFSGASLFVGRLVAARKATIVGETMSGSPNTWANPRPLTLGATGLEAQVSTQFEPGPYADDERLAIDPDRPVPIAWADIAAHRDPVLATVLAAIP
jgi:hypothetical protein